MLSVIGLLGGLAFLIILTFRGRNLLITAPLGALVVGVFSEMPLFPQTPERSEANLVGKYMAGFSGFVASWFLMFLAGAIFGKVIEESGSAETVSKWVVQRLGAAPSVLAVVLACAVLTYGGVSLFVVAFSVRPVALNLFREANLPRRFIPAALAFGSVTFTMTSAGSPEIQNWIPIEYLGTSPYAGWQVSLAVALFMMISGHLWLMWMIRRARIAGESFQTRGSDTKSTIRKLPHPIRGLFPLLVVLALPFALHPSLKQSPLIVALVSGISTVYWLCRPHLVNFWEAASAGAVAALSAIGNTASVVGFGDVAKAAPAFKMAVVWVTSIPGDALLTAAIAVSLIAGLTGSASGGQAIALPLLAPHYLRLGVDAEELHRVVALSSGALDTLPHNGYVVTTLKAICDESYRDAYLPMAALTCVVPAIGTLLAVALFYLF